VPRATLRGNSEIANAIDWAGITLALFAERQRGLGRAESAGEGDILSNIVIFFLHRGEYINKYKKRRKRKPAQ